MRHRLSECPVCRVSYSEGKSRNMVAEKLVQILKKQIQQQEQVMKNSKPNVSNSRITFSANAAVAGSSNAIIASVPPQQAERGRGVRSCDNFLQGCSFEGTDVSRRGHEPNCHYRRIVCSLSTDGCNNSEIAFSNFFAHLIDQHHVKTYQGDYRVHKYFINNYNNKLVRSKCFIIIQLCFPFISCLQTCIYF